MKTILMLALMAVAVYAAIIQVNATVDEVKGAIVKDLTAAGLDFKVKHFEGKGSVLTYHADTKKLESKDAESYYIVVDTSNLIPPFATRLLNDRENYRYQYVYTIMQDTEHPGNTTLCCDQTFEMRTFKGWVTLKSAKQADEEEVAKYAAIFKKK